MRTLGVVIPYRDRVSHLEALLPALDAHLRKHHPRLPYIVVVAEQYGHGVFNRGAMKNAGFVEAAARGATHCAFHDVDMIPMDAECDYSCPEMPTRIAGKITTGPGKPVSNTWRRYFGGVVVFRNEHFRRVNGYSNEYWGWGAEDEDLRYRCVSSGLVVRNRQGLFRAIKHPTHRAQDGDLPEKNRKRLEQVRAGEIPTAGDGLNSLRYQALSACPVRRGVRVMVRL